MQNEPWFILDTRFQWKIIKSFLNLPEEQTMAIIAVGRLQKINCYKHRSELEVNQFFNSNEYRKSQN